MVRQSFWDRFVARVDEADIPAISKFSYLQSLKEGEVKSVIQGLSLTAKKLRFCMYFAEGTFWLT